MHAIYDELSKQASEVKFPDGYILEGNICALKMVGCEYKNHSNNDEVPSNMDVVNEPMLCMSDASCAMWYLFSLYNI